MMLAEEESGVELKSPQTIVGSSSLTLFASLKWANFFRRYAV